MRICIFLFLLSYLGCSCDSLNEVLTATNTRLYFLMGTQASRIRYVNTFIKDMAFDRNYIQFVQCVRKEKLNRIELYNLKVQNFITDQWIERYITGVDDPMSKDKNLGKLALMLTLQNAMKMFLKSPYTNMLVFEDDVMINTAEFNKSTAQQELSKMIALPQTQWDIQYLGFCFECGNATGYTPPPLVDNRYTQAVFPLCKHALLMSRSMVELFVKAHTPVTNNKGDWVFHEVACRHHLNVLRTRVPLFLQRGSEKMESSLGNHNDKRPFAQWVSCEQEEKKCMKMGNQYSKHKAIAS